MTEREKDRAHPLVHSSMLCHSGAEFPLRTHGDFHKVDSAKGYGHNAPGCRHSYSKFTKATSHTFIDTPQ